MCFLGHYIHPESISMNYHQGCDRIKVEINDQKGIENSPNILENKQYASK